MSKTVRQLLGDLTSDEPRYVRLYNAEYTTAQLLAEIMFMADQIVSKISGAQMTSRDRRVWSVREVASKWDSIKAYPEMLQGVDSELLKILVLDAYADAERLGAT